MTSTATVPTRCSSTARANSDRIITELRRHGTFDLVTLTVTGRYTPLVADYDGNGRDDVLWYR